MGNTMSKAIFITVLLALVISTAVSAKTITLSWEPSPDSNVAGYKVYYNSGSSGLPLNGSGASQGSSPINVGTALSSSLTNLPDDQVHYLAVTAYDASGNESDYSNIVTSDIVVNNTNHAPVLAVIGSKNVSEGGDLSFAVSASDSDGDSLTFSASNLPAGAVFDLATRTFSWTPSSTQAGNYIVTFSVSDGSLSDSEMVAINVGNVNHDPVLAAIGTKSLSVGASLNFTISAGDADGDSLSYSASGLPSGAAFNTATRTFNWSPSTTQGGNYVVTFSVSDGTASDSEAVIINVLSGNNPPVMTEIGPKSINEGETQHFTLSATDPDGDPLTFSAPELPVGAVLDPVTHHFSWKTSTGQAGTYYVPFEVSDGSLSASITVKIKVLAVNQSPTLTVSGSKTVLAGSALSFAVSASDPNGDSLTYTSTTLPSGASFNAANGNFSWTPDSSQVGSHSITFSVSDGTLSDSASVAIVVESNASLDSDGDGVADIQDAFPQDPSETIDSDQDGIGNNADTDDDNDGVSDEADSSPLDPDTYAWIISATTSEGGLISPAGSSLLEYGGAQVYSMAADSGYYLSDVLVDGNSVGPVAEYVFAAVNSHHTIEAVFLPASNGLSLVTGETGLSGVDRLDGGDDSSNYVDGSPKGDLEYVFRIVAQHTSSEPVNVALSLNGYAYEMVRESGNLETGAIYSFITRLGPAATQRFHFEIRDDSGNMLTRFPAESELAGPRVELMNGKNIVGVPGNIAPEQLTSVEALGSSLSYRWIPSEKRNGSYERIETGAPVTNGEGYVIKRTTDMFLPSLDHFGEEPAASFEIPVKTGWNLIANPYGGNVPLSEVLVQSGNSATLSWNAAVADLQVVDGLYYYAGRDWGNKNIFESSSSERGAILIPRVGYWIYVNSESESVSLVIPKPQQ